MGIGLLVSHAHETAATDGYLDGDDLRALHRAEMEGWRIPRARSDARRDRSAPRRHRYRGARSERPPSLRRKSRTATLLAHDDTS